MEKSILRMGLSLWLISFALSSSGAAQVVDLNTGELFQGEVSTQPIQDVMQDESGITVTYRFDYAALTESDGNAGVFNWGADGLSICTEPGEPAIMAVRDIFNVTGFGGVKVEITSSNYVDLPYELAGAPYPVSNPESVKPAEPINPYTGFFPESLTTVSDCYNVLDGTYVDVDLKAIQYNYETKTIRAYRSVTYRITPAKSAGSPELAQSLALDEPRLDENMEYVVSNPGSAMALASPTSADLGLLLVTSPELADVTNEYAEYKRSLGFRTHVLVPESRTEADTLNIKSSIQQILTDDPTVSYLLIVGDQNHVPAFKNWIKSANGTIRQHLTDLYYVADYNSYVPSIKYGRIPVSTKADVEIVFEKIKKYELTPPTKADFYNNHLFVSKFERAIDDWSPIKDPRRESPGYRFIEVAEKLAQNLENDYNKSIDKKYDIELTDNTDKPFPAPAWYSNGSDLEPYLKDLSFYDTTNITRAINNGVSCFFYNAHGGIAYAISGWYTVKAIEYLTNGDMLPVVLGVSCLLGAYDKTQSFEVNGHLHSDQENFAKTFIKHPKGGCVGILAATNIAWVTPNNIFSNGLFECLYPGTANPTFVTKPLSGSHSLRMGNVLDYATKLVKANYSSNKYVKDNTEVYHYFGDPTMRMRTKEPEQIDEPTIYVLQSSGTYKLTALSKNGQEYSIYQEGEQPVRSAKGFVSRIIANPLTTPTTICINGDNKIPVLKTLSNEDVTPSQTMSARYNAANRTITASYFASSEYNSAHVDIYDINGNYVGSTENVKPTGTRIEQTYKVNSLSMTKSFIVCLVLDGKGVYSVIIS